MSANQKINRTVVKHSLGTHNPQHALLMTLALRSQSTFIALLITIALTAIGLVTMVANADAQFTNGQRVYATGILNSRSMVQPAPLAQFSTAACSISKDKQGSIISGPFWGTIQGGTTQYTWYQINWDGGTCSNYGWSADINLAAVPVNHAPTLPGAPTAVTGTVTASGATISWGASSDADGDTITYAVEYTKYNTPTDPWHAASTTTGLTLPISGLAANTQYNVRVQASDGKGGLSGWNKTEPAFTTTQTLAGTVRVTANSSSGSTLAVSEMNAVILFNSSVSEIARKQPPSSNPMEFTGVSYGSYFVDVYCWDMLAAESSTFTHNSSLSPITLTTNPERGLTVTAFYSDGTTRLPGATVYLDSWNGQYSSWTQRASATTDSSGMASFSAWPTTQTGEKYRIRVTNGGTQVGLRDPVAVANIPIGSAYSINTSVVSPNNDTNDQISEAAALGAMQSDRSTTGNISESTDVAMFSFSVTQDQRITFEANPASGSSLTPYLRLFNASGTELPLSYILVTATPLAFYTFPVPGTYYIGVSDSGNSSYNPITGGGDTSGSTGAYTLSVKPAGFFTTINGATLFIQRRDIVSGAIDPSVTTWLVIHGRDSASNEPNISSLIEAIHLQRPGDQVLALDWKDLAADFGPPAWTIGEDYIQPVAIWAASVLSNYGFSANNLKLNLVGHSWGANMTDEIAERITGGVGVNTIVALDPAANGNGNYNPEGTDGVFFAAHSKFSWAFHSSCFGSAVTPPTADEAFIVATGYPDIAGAGQAHSSVVLMFTDIIKNPTGGSGINPLFKLDRLLKYEPSPWWVPNTESSDFACQVTAVGGYEGVIALAADHKTPEQIRYRPTAPEITALGNGISITDGATPGSTDGTDFGSVIQGQAGPTHTFTVRNDGGTTLTLGSVSVPPGFIIDEGLLTSLNPGVSDTFTVRLDTTSAGSKSGQISFSNNDSDENPFNFSITGTVTAPSDVTPPTVTITSPTSGTSYSTSSTPITIGVTASDTGGVSSVTWSNAATGGSGSCTGTTSWTCSSISLNSGLNNITITAKDAANNPGTDTLAVTYTPSDTTPPTPNPTWATQPYALGTTSISMVATAATDSGSPPVSYYFDFVSSPTGGTGGVDSGWQGSITYTNSGLQPNQRYGYEVKARDSASTPNETPYSSVTYIYTLANTPGTSSFSNISQTGIQANWTTNGNRSGTDYYSENITKGTNSGWVTNTYWNSTGLACGISYSFRVKARNGDGIETNWTNLGSQSTQSCSCDSSSLTVSVSAPSSGFIAGQGSGTLVKAAVTDNCLGSVMVATVTASFSNGDASITLFDDGAHNDGSANDGVYAYTWTPNNIGNCAITVTASKAGLSTGNGIVSGTVQQQGSSNFKLPDTDTGQTKCYQGVSPYAEIPCAGTGQDGAYNINPMSFTGNGTVTDNNTGLMWQQQDDGNTYNWYQASGTYDATYNPSTINICGALGSDWRLPSKKELISIVDYSILYPGPTINPIFTNTKQSYYWSSTTGASYPGSAWYVYFSYGNVDYYYKDSSLYVRCVRGGQSGSFGNFDDNHDGTITDTSTGLMWQQSEPEGMPWSNALNYCENLELPSGSGQTDWRLPNIKELESITDDTIYNNPAIDRNFFPNASASDYWSSTTVAGYPGYPWCVYFYDGYVDGGGDGYYDKGSSLYVRCVRGGQSGSLGNLNISKSGNGTGTITSNPAGINCGASCSSQFSLNQVVTLSACPSTGGHIFSGWSGDDDCADGIVTLSADKSCTAAFNQCNPESIAMTGGLGAIFGSINAAYAGAESSDTIKIIASNQQENLVFSTKNLALQGGYDCTFTEPPTSLTTITGSLTISGGSVSIGEIRIQ